MARLLRWRGPGCQPHSDARYPGVVDELMESVAAMPRDAARALVGATAARVYGVAAAYVRRAALAG
jgi:hypothetical protein